ncbi:GxxExxY protein [candidate division KSB1 bacterium]|nr:GxxExxY protein [candidate division KSB1 bacterium]
MEFEEITEKIIGLAYKVYNTLGFGFVESVYENALSIELRRAGFIIQKQPAINVYYEGELVGKFKADIIVNEVVILELKSVQTIVREFEVQLVNYLTATGKPVGLILNFGPSKVEIKRKVRVLPKEE